MSGPVEERDLQWVEEGKLGVVVREGRRTRIGPTEVVRVLPTKGRRTIGGWCFFDLMTPPDALEPNPLEIGPHPHIGLSTVTWLFTGEALHSDSLGTEQVIRPGQLNLMTAGHGIAHAELSPADGVEGAQLWIAQPERTRHGAAAFEHHAELPRVEWAGGEASVLVGTFGEASSPARADTPLIGAELQLYPSVSEIELDPSFEYGFVPIDNPVKVDDAIVEPGWLGLIEGGQDRMMVDPGGSGARVMLLGGAPLGEGIEMWWNFVARSKDEITEAWQAWQDHDTDRFASVPSSLARIDAPRPPWLPGE